MRTAVLATSLTLALSSLVTLAPAASAAPAPAAAAPGATHWVPLCANHSCKSRVKVDADGHVIHSATPTGLTALDIEKAYSIDVSLGTGVTVAVIDAYGYTDLEADLAVYRAAFNLPPCTVASGCLTIVNDDGNTSPLPAQVGNADGQGWIGETALDVDMVSAACPACKIVVVQASTEGIGLDLGETTAAKLGVDTISNSWGTPESSDAPTDEQSFNNPGIGTFVSSGDGGYDNPAGGAVVAPDYPSTSQYAIAVGGTTLTVDSTNARGYTETTWNHDGGAGGSSCSLAIAKPSWQPASAQCSMRAASDLSAVADGGAQGIAEYVGKQGGWSEVDGTSAASPATAALFAGAGHADVLPAFIYAHPAAFLDVTVGTNFLAGSPDCQTNLCHAGVGWDGPTGVGTPNQALIKAIGGVAGSGPDIAITFPADGGTVASNFTIEVAPGSDASWVEIDIDGTKIGGVNAAPFDLSAPISLADGAHTVTAIAYDIDHNSKSTMINITQGATTGGDDGGGGGCAAGGSGGAGAGLVLALGALVTRRKKTA